jgi:hypothetical protein
MKRLSNDKLIAHLSTVPHPYKSRFKAIDSLQGELKKWYRIAKDTSSSDSLKAVGRSHVKRLATSIAMKDPKFQGLYEHYKQYGQKPELSMLNQEFPGLDSLSEFWDSSPEKLMQTVERVAEAQALDQVGGANVSSLDQMNGIDKQLDQFKDPKGAIEELKNKSILGTEDLFAGQSSQLQAARTKVSGLMSKYREFTDSNDLTGAVKRTSLTGRTFKERIVFGGNFNVVSTDPISIDIAPIFGYRVNTGFVVGVGLNYRHTFGDSLKYKLYISPVIYSVRGFTNYNVYKNFFVTAEYERAGLKLKRSENQSIRWTNNYLIGVGRKFLIHPKVYLVMTALYNLKGEGADPSYPRHFQLRIGLQNTDLALRRKRIYYK